MAMGVPAVVSNSYLESIVPFTGEDHWGKTAGKVALTATVLIPLVAVALDLITAVYGYFSTKEVVLETPPPAPPSEPEEAPDPRFVFKLDPNLPKTIEISQNKNSNEYLPLKAYEWRDESNLVFKFFDPSMPVEEPAPLGDEPVLVAGPPPIDDDPILVDTPRSTPSPVRTPQAGTRTPRQRSNTPKSTLSPVRTPQIGTRTSRQRSNIPHVPRPLALPTQRPLLQKARVSLPQSQPPARVLAPVRRAVTQSQPAATPFVIPRSLLPFIKEQDSSRLPSSSSLQTTRQSSTTKSRPRTFHFSRLLKGVLVSAASAQSAERPVLSLIKPPELNHTQQFRSFQNTSLVPAHLLREPPTVKQTFIDISQGKKDVSILLGTNPQGSTRTFEVHLPKGTDQQLLSFLAEASEETCVKADEEDYWHRRTIRNICDTLQNPEEYVRTHPKPMIVRIIDGTAEAVSNLFNSFLDRITPDLIPDNLFF